MYLKTSFISMILIGSTSILFAQTTSLSSSSQISINSSSSVSSMILPNESNSSVSLILPTNPASSSNSSVSSMVLPNESNSSVSLILPTNPSSSSSSSVSSMTLPNESNSSVSLILPTSSSSSSSQMVLPNGQTMSSSSSSINNDVYSGLNQFSSSSSSFDAGQIISELIMKIQSFTGDTQATKDFAKEIILTKKEIMQKLNMNPIKEVLNTEYKNSYKIIIGGKKELLVGYFTKVKEDINFIGTTIDENSLSVFGLTNTGADSISGSNVQPLVISGIQNQSNSASILPQTTSANSSGDSLGFMKSLKSMMYLVLGAIVLGLIIIIIFVKKMSKPKPEISSQVNPQQDLNIDSLNYDYSDVEVKNNQSKQSDVFEEQKPIITENISKSQTMSFDVDSGIQSNTESEKPENDQQEDKFIL